MNSQTFSKSVNFPTKLSVAITIAMLSACGGSGQDQGVVATQAQKQSFAGLAIDGHLARAKVYIDSDNNGTRDAWEPYAFTDNDGYYSFNPKTLKDYCADNASKEDAQYCLRTERSYDNAVIRTEGGYDALTGEPFAGQLSRRLNSVTPGSNNASLVSPLTSLTASLSDAETAALLQKFDLKKSDLDSDYANSSGEVNNKLLNVALKLHKSVTLLSDRLGDNYSALGNEAGTPADASFKIYEHLANEIKASDKPLDEILADTSLLKRVVQQTENDVKALYDFKKIALPGNAGDTTKFDRVVDSASNLPAVVNALIPNDKTYTLQEAQGGARALEALVIKSVKEGPNDATVDAAIDFLRNGSDDARQNLVDSLSGDKADVSLLAGNSFAADNFATPETTATATQLPATATTFSGIGGHQLRVADTDVGQAPNNLRDIEFEVYFNGDAQATSGSLNACAKYVKDAKSDGTLGKGNSRGELIGGYWSLMNTGDEKSSYSILLTFTFLGANYQAIMKSAGTTDINGVTYQQLRFDNNDDYRIWNSEKGMQLSSGVPASSAECQTRLPSRIGI